MKNIWQNIFVLVFCGFWIGDIISKFELVWYFKFLIPVVITLIGWLIYKLYELYFVKRISIDKYRKIVLLFFAILGIVDVMVENNANVGVFISLMTYSGVVVSLMVEKYSLTETNGD